jgi:tRNA(Ile)-lysidine synthase TilS/MesJ
MILVLALYFGSIFYLVKKVIETTKMFEDESSNDLSNITSNEITDIINMKLNMNFDKENVVYKAFMLEVNKNEMDTNKQALICCTGDEQSMALLAIASTVFNHIHVLLINHDKTEILKEFIEDICDFNEFTLHCIDTSGIISETTSDTGSDESSDTSSEIASSDVSSRYEHINEICIKNDIKYVFEGHNMINYSNNILNDIYTNNIVATQQIDPLGHINSKPFLLIDNITLLKFISYYNIPIDNNYTHLEYSKIKNKTMFTDMDCYTSMIYPEWRINLIEYYKNNKNIIDTEIIDNNCYKGKYGFLFYHDFNKISFTAFKKVVNKLCSQYNFYVFSNDEFNNYYLTEEDVSYFINEDYNRKINKFEEEFKSNVISDMIENNSDNSFSELEIDTNSNSSSSELEIDNKEKEYIFRVDLNNDTPKMKLVDELSDKFREEYLDGIIYINIIDITNNTFFIYDINTEFVHDD